MSREIFNQNIKNENRMKLIRDFFHISSQANLSELLGLPIHKIKDIESGKVKISVEIALLLEEKFNLNFKWILTGKGEMRVKSVCGDLKQDMNHNIVADSLGDGVIMLIKIHAAKNRTHYDNTIKYLKRTADIVEMEEGGKISGDD